MATMKDLAALLGVEIGEEFEISDIPITYRLTDTALEACVGDYWKVSYRPNLIPDLLFGKHKIIKKPWKPKGGNNYYVVSDDGSISLVWSNDAYDLAFYAVGNCFRTLEEAERHKDEVLAKLNEIYETGKPLLEW